MQEEFLHFIWRMKNFSSLPLRTTKGEEITILSAGDYNTNAGPDFLNAKIKIGKTTWAGSIEIHLKSSDWLQHGHSTDENYNNVVLHAVYEDDRPIGKDIPVVELKHYIAEGTLATYNLLKSSLEWIPCQNFLPEVKDMTKLMWMDRMIVERLEVKSDVIKQMLDACDNDWQECCYRLTGRNFGFKVNADAFEELCTSLPHKVIGKHKNSLKQIEALLYGQAGFLKGDFKDEFPKELQKEYAFLASKYGLKPMNKTRWKFMRLRPANFPTIRIAQFAALLHKSEHLFSRFLEIKNPKEVIPLLEVVTSFYWKDHYRFDTASEGKLSWQLGKSSIENLVINTVAPILFSYGHIKQVDKHKDMALKLLEQLKPEQNKITRGWEALGIENKNAMLSQALIHLKNNYCSNKLCLSCGIGSSILKPSKKPNLEILS